MSPTNLLTLVAAAVAASILFAARRGGNRLRMAPWLTLRFKILLVGALLGEARYWAMYAAARHSFPTLGEDALVYQALLMLQDAVSFLILYQIVRPLLSHVRAITFLPLLFATWYLDRWVNIAISFIVQYLSGRPLRLYIDYYSNPRHWLLLSFRFPQTLMDIAVIAIFLAISYYLTFGSTPSFGNSRTASAPAYGGSTMLFSETTRLLCASGLLSRQFRSKVLEHFEDRNRACSPEVGVDLPLVVQVCQFAADREKRYPLFYFLILVVGAIIALAIHPVLGAIAFILASAALYLQHSLQSRSLVRDYFQRGNFDVVKVRERFQASLKPEVVDAFPRPDLNLVVYQGFTPFIGAGINQGGWSFTVDIEKPRENELDPTRPKTPVPFTCEEFYQAVKTKIRSLRLERMTIDDYCFVNGSDIREDRNILPDIYGRPVQKLAEAAMAWFRNSSDSRIRHYLWVRIYDWGNEIVMSYFFRVALRGSSLFVEINRFLLTPLFTTYREADKITGLRFSEYIAEILKCLVLGPVYAIFSWAWLLSQLNEALERLLNFKSRARRKEIESNPLYNYGAESSLRYTFSTSSFLHYFQKLDGEFYNKVLEHQILDGIIDFLERHNIETSEIRERRTTILNSGVIVQGGDIRAETLAVGTGATAVKSQATSTQKKIKEKGVEA